MWLVTFLKFLVNIMENKITTKYDSDIRTPTVLKPQLILMFISSLATMNVSHFNPRA